MIFQICQIASKSFSSAYYNYQKGLAAYERIYHFSSLASFEEQKTSVSAFANIKSSIQFKELSFSYPKEEKKALDRISLELQKGKTVALVGASGSGKTSLLNLLLKFYRPDSGMIEVDGVPLENISTADWRKSIALVTQDPFLFHDSIYENIKFGRAYINRETAKRALKQAQLEKFTKLLDQSVGERGQMLSGGEKQRLAIARALAGDPELLLLDEPTSALDAQAEREVSAAIQKAMEGRMAIIIAHRFSTIKHADVIVVLDGGKIVQQGTHEQLAAQDGYYKRYLELQ